MATAPTIPASNTTNDDIMDQLQLLYFYLNDNFTQIIGMCTNDDQRNQVKDELIVARDAYMKAQNEILTENDGVLSGITGQIAGLQQQIDSAVSSAGDITKILGFIASATGMAAKIVTLVTS
jgi:hypothetical protein